MREAIKKLLLITRKYLKQTKIGQIINRMRKAKWHSKEGSLKQMRSLWDDQSKKSTYGYISHLQPGAEWDLEEFNLVGTRFVNRITERFIDYGATPLSDSNVLEIGCGVGRFLKPLSGLFREVWGVDISEQMIKAATKYLSSIANIRLSVNDGATLKGFDDNSFDYCFSAGVFQHITHPKVIIAYIREAIRILRPGGVFLFQFSANKIEAIGSGSTGARVTATLLEEGLSGLLYRIREVSIDPNDPVRNVVIVLEKTPRGSGVSAPKQSFATWKMTERPWLSGVYDGIKTRTLMHKRLEKGFDRLTFYDDNS